MIKPANFIICPVFVLLMSFLYTCFIHKVTKVWGTNMNKLVQNIIITLFTVFGFGLTSINVNGSGIPEITEKSVIDSTGNNKLQVLLLPIIFSSPDTRLAVGVLPQIVFRSSSSNNPSSIRMDAYYTLNKQYHLLLRPVFWYQNDTRNINGKLSFKKWPTSFYGIGRDVETSSIETFTETLYETSIEAITQIIPGLFAGAGYSLRYGEITPDNDTGILAAGTIRGSGNTFISGLGGVLQYDTRDNHFYPESGSLHKFEIYTASKMIGSDYGFTRFTFDARRYISLYPSHVIAIQAVGMFTAGSVPFRVLPSVGNVFRGYSSVRYIDRHLIALQAEYRVVPLTWRVGFTAFAGISDVFSQLNDISHENLKYVVGMGIRYQFSRSEKINIRLDYGIGRKSSGDYIDINEAF